MKKERHAAIRDLLKEQTIRSQKDLVDALRLRGISATQATVSRDMKELHLIRVPAESGGFRYTEPEISIPGLSERMIRLLCDCVVQVEAAGQMIVVKTMSGSASTAAETLDSLEMPEIAGSIAGDNTIFLVARDPGSAMNATKKIQRLLKR